MDCVLGIFLFAGLKNVFYFVRNMVSKMWLRTLLDYGAVICLKQIIEHLLKSYRRKKMKESDLKTCWNPISQIIFPLPSTYEYHFCLRKLLLSGVGIHEARTHVHRAYLGT